MSDERQPAATKPKISRIEVYWTAVTYRSVVVYLVLFFAILMATLYFAYPDWYGASYRRLSNAAVGCRRLSHHAR